MKDIRKKISDRGLRVTPQRIAILEIISNLHTHPTADDILQELKKTHPNIAIGTVYKVLDAFVENGIINKITSRSDKMRYDANTEYHHHLHCTETDKIVDYKDEKLNQLLKEYFENKKIEGFNIENIVLQLNGIFK